MSLPLDKNSDILETRFRAFQAIQSPEECERFIEGHVEVLKIFGITKITSAKKDWMVNPATYVVIAESLDGKELYGGIRVQKVGSMQPLPVEEAVGYMDSRIYDLVKDHHQNGGAGELCGLWNSRNVAGKGLSVLLVRAGLSLVNQINVRTIFGICAELTLPMFLNAGYVIENSLGTNGTFYYPKEDLLAYALMMDAVNLPTANETDRTRINSLKDSPSQEFIENGPKGLVKAFYELKLKAQ